MLHAMLASSTDATLWMPQQSSTVAGSVDFLFHFIMYVCYFFFFLIAALMFGFAIKYRHREGVADHPAPAGHNNLLEMAWTVPPALIVLFVFWHGFRNYMNMAVIPPNTYDITAQGQMWKWTFQYPNGHIDETLHVPVNQPVKIITTSSDVIHSLFIPDFRTKKDAVPGRLNTHWFQATIPGEYPIYCAEYCGTNHSEMLSKVVVHENRKMFDDWLADASKWQDKLTPQARGAQLWAQRGCNACHSIDGTKLVGPSWKDIFGRTEHLADGSTITVDENYLRDSIFYPGKQIVAGYPNQMPSYLGQLAEDDVQALIWYMKELTENFNKSQLPTKPPLLEASTTTPPPATPK